MIKYYNRNTKGYETETTVAGKSINWAYSTLAGKSCLEIFLKRKMLSKIAGWYYNRKISRNKIQGFVKKYRIDMKGSLKDVKDFRSFNDFFTRKLTHEARPIESDPSILISPCDGKLLAFEGISSDCIFKIKDFKYSLAELIQDQTIVDLYEGGTCLIFRLAPTDYHRYHFIDNGICDEINVINGHYYSVNINALKKIPDIYLKNKREWCSFHSDNFDDVIYVEVGATFVGSIIQTYLPCSRIYKGQEKGYFKFGGSTVILLFKKGTVEIDSDILEQTKQNYETKVIMGEKIGVKKADE